MPRFLIALLLLSLLALPARAEDPGITTTGTATVLATPDQAIFTINLTHTDAEITRASARSAADADTLVKAVKAAGIADADVTAALSILPQLRSDGTTLTGFTVARTCTITLRDLKGLERLFNAIALSGVGKVPTVELRVADPRPLRDQARTLAIRAAKDKAATFAREAGGTLGTARTIIENPAPASDGPTESITGGRMIIQTTVRATFNLTFEK